MPSHAVVPGATGKRRELSKKGHGESFWGEMLRYDCGDGYRTVYICQKKLNWTPKIC